MINNKCQEGWETLKDHPIDRAGDLKHRPISGGAPKNAFLFLYRKMLIFVKKNTDFDTSHFCPILSSIMYFDLKWSFLIFVAIMPLWKKQI